MCVEHRMWFKIADKTDIATVAICMVSTVLKWRIKLFCLGSCNSMGWRKYSGSNVYLWCAKNTLLWLQSYIPHLTNQPDKNKASEGFLFLTRYWPGFCWTFISQFSFCLGRVGDAGWDGLLTRSHQKEDFMALTIWLPVGSSQLVSLWLLFLQEALSSF